MQKALACFLHFFCLFAYCLNIMHRFALIKTDRSGPTFQKRTCLFAKVVGYNHTARLWTMQPYNSSGEKEGKADDERASNVHLLPPPGRRVVRSNGKHFDVGSYCQATQSVLLEEVDGASKVVATDGASKVVPTTPVTSKSKSKKRKRGKKKKTPPKKKTKKNVAKKSNKKSKKKPLDNATSSSGADVQVCIVGGAREPVPCTRSKSRRRPMRLQRMQPSVDSRLHFDMICACMYFAGCKQSI